MLNWGDKESAERLAAQLKELLRDRTMTFDQLAAVYSIKNGQSIRQRLKEMSRDRKEMTFPQFVSLMTDYFEPVGANRVRALSGASAAGDKTESSGGLDSSTAGKIDAGTAASTVASAAAAEPARALTPVAAAPPVSKSFATMKYADVSRCVQRILREQQGPLSVKQLEEIFQTTYGTGIEDIVGISTGEYLVRKENLFHHNAARGTVSLQSAMSSSPPSPPTADPDMVKDEAFVVREFEQLIEVMGPVVYISTLCGKFIQRNGTSVTSIISTRPADLFKRHPDVFMVVGAGNVTLKKYETLPEVSRLIDKPSSKALRISKAAEEARLPVPDIITEQHVVDEFRRLILSDGNDTAYISSLCGRFLQRFKKPVTSIITCKPTDFLRRYPDIFVMTGGGNVGLREVLGPCAVSVPPPPPRVPKMFRDDGISGNESSQQTEQPDDPEGVTRRPAIEQHQDDEEYHDGEEDEDEDFHDANEG